MEFCKSRFAHVGIDPSHIGEKGRGTANIERSSTRVKRFAALSRFPISPALSQRLVMRCDNFESRGRTLVFSEDQRTMVALILLRSFSWSSDSFSQTMWLYCLVSKWVVST